MECFVTGRRFFQCVFLLLLCFPAVSNSQTRDTTLQGQVVDAAGAPVPETRLLIINLNTLEEQRAVVKDKGKFSFQQLPSGDYALIAAAPVDTPCYRPVVERVKLEADSTRTVRLVMIANPGACAAGQKLWQQSPRPVTRLLAQSPGMTDLPVCR